MNKQVLLIDIRNSDEVMALRFDPVYMTNYYNIPMNMIRFNKEVIIKHLEYVDTIYLVCSTGNRSKFIKNKYFKDNSRIKVDPRLQFKNFKNYNKPLNIQLDTDNITVFITGNNSFNLYNLTRIIQIVLGTIMIISFLFIYNIKKVNIVIKSILALMGTMALFNGLTNTCTLSLLLRNTLN